MKSTFSAIFVLGTVAWAQPPGGGPPGMGAGDGVWSRNAAFGELETFDLCNGHQPGSGMYHHHINPVCLRAQLNDNVSAVYTGRLGTQYAENTTGWTHSPILGWASDGYPVYGPYGYSDPADSTSPIKRVQSSFRLRDITVRHSLPDWVLSYQPNVPQNLPANRYGPDVSSAFPLGRYIQDYEYVAGLGDLDPYNGRFTVTPDYPAGTYAYFVTLAAHGSPAFPYIINVQLYGTAPGGGPNATVASDAADYFTSGGLTQAASTDPRLASWYTAGSQQFATAISGYDPSAGASTTWPQNVPAGIPVMGGNSTPALADVQRVRYNANSVYVNSNNLPSYALGPWFEASMPGGVFMNWASGGSRLIQLARNPTPAAGKSASGMGPVGMWVNGVAIFNTLDGASYSTAAGDDQGGGRVSPRATHYSAASHERGPLAAGSLVSAYPEFTVALANTTATAQPAWPTTLGGATVTVTDSTGAQFPAGILYAAPDRVDYQMPAGAAPGPGRVTITAGGNSVTGTVNITTAYPGVFTATPDGLADAETLTMSGNDAVTEPVWAAGESGHPQAAPIDLSSGQVYLVLHGTGIGSAGVTATIDGVNVPVADAGPQAEFPGRDMVKLSIPSSMTGKGRVSVVVTAVGKSSNPVYVVIQ